MANKIFIGIHMCTYKACRDSKRKGFGDFWEVKRGLTGVIGRFAENVWLGFGLCDFPERVEKTGYVPSVPIFLRT